MSVKGGPGQGTTLSLSIDTTIARLRNIQPPAWSSGPVDFTGLADLEWFCLLAANLKDGGAFTADLYYDTEIVLPTLKVVQTATITWPIQTDGNTVKAALVGSGFVTQLGFAAAAVGEPLIQPIAFQFDGDTVPPAYTVEAAA